MSRFKRGELILAAFEFSKLIKNMPVSEFVPQAQFMLAESYYELSPNYTLDQKYTKKAIEEYQAFLDFFPANPSVPEAEKKIRELYAKSRAVKIKNEDDEKSKINPDKQRKSSIKKSGNKKPGRRIK